MQQNYSGQLFHDSGQRLAVDVCLASSGPEIKVQGSNETWQISWDEIEIELGGAANSLVFFQSKADVPWTSFYLQKNRQLLSDLAAFSHPSPQAFLQERRRRQHRSWLLTSAALGLLFVAIIGLYRATGPLAAAAVSLVPYEWEQKLGEKLVDLYLPSRERHPSEAALQSLREGMDRLRAELPEDMRDFEVHIKKDPSVNAFALPGGQLIFHTGLLQQASRMEEVLAVGAHELSHVVNRHGMRALARSVGVFLVIDLAIGDVSGWLAVLADNSHLLLQRQFSQQQETQADADAFDRLLAARIDPRHLIRFFDILEEENSQLESQAGEVLSLLSTHPLTAERRKALRERIAALQQQGEPDYQDVPINYNDFLQHLK